MENFYLLICMRIANFAPLNWKETMRLNGMNENVMRCAAISYGGGQKYSSDESLNLIDITEYPGGC